MKIFEAIFEIAYLILVITSGIILLKKRRNDAEHMMGNAVLFLGIGDAFHLIPRIVGYFAKVNLSEALGIGTLITSITMTIFYVYVYYIYLEMISDRRINKKP